MIEKTLLHAQNLSRSFGEYQALKPVSLTIQSGDLIALSGPNGSGKTTLLQCLTGLLRPSTGEILVEGHDLYLDEVQARERLAYVPDVAQFYQELTAWEHLCFIAQAHHVLDRFENRAKELLQEFDLWEARDLFPHAYSRGMRLKLSLLIALIRPFSVLIMDEPSSALDVESSALLSKKITTLADSGLAVLLSTHDPQFIQTIGAKTWNIRDGVVDLY
jgi:ABC-2 type transport system ATP-binding protein